MQQDVQEFSRVLFDKLEEKMKGTNVEGVIKELFVGKVQNVIECVNVDFKSKRVEEFYDLQLEVKDCETVMDSFRKYTKGEMLQGENQYDAGEQHGKQDAKMSVSFESLPPVLHLHLMRYEYNAKFGAMVELHNRHEFPLVLNLSEFLSDAEEKEEVFLLHSVLVHSGGMQCGHYTGYIRPFLGDKDPERSDRWFCFDDDHVYSVTSKEAVESNFGGNERLFRRAKTKRRKLSVDGTDDDGNKNQFKNEEEKEHDDDDDDDYDDVLSLLPSSGGSSSCAYMLAYVRERDLDKVMNSSFLVPKSLEIRIENEIHEEKERMRKIEREKMMVDVAVWTDRHVCSYMNEEYS